MCISNSKADFSATKGYIGEAQTKEHGLVHVLGYQNSVKNKVDGPNAMILHFPAKELMGKNNVIDLGDKGKGYLKDLCEKFEEKSRGLTKGVYTNFAKVEIFETGIYTVVISNKPSLINEALKEIPENKRPDINPELMLWYEKNYPGYSVAVCCFDAKEAKAEQLFWWYKPINEDELFFPAVDCHSGGLPQFNETVATDHMLTCAVLDFNPSAANVIKVKDLNDIYLDEKNREFFSDKVMGNKHRVFNAVNGDFVIKKEDVRTGKPHFRRQQGIK